MITATGWTFEYIDEFMDLPRQEVLNKHWKRSPPVHFSVAAYLGWGKSDGASSPEQHDSDFDTLMMSTPQMDMRPKHG